MRKGRRSRRRGRDRGFRRSISDGPNRVAVPFAGRRAVPAPGCQGFRRDIRPASIRARRGALSMTHETDNDRHPPDHGPRGRVRRRPRSVVLPRRLRRGVRRPPRRQGDPRDDRPRPGRARPPRASRRGRRRRVDRRRRRDHVRAPARVLPLADRRDRHEAGRPARPREARRRDVLHPPRLRRRHRADPAADRGAGRRSGPSADRLAPGPGRRDLLRPARARVGAADQPALHRGRRRRSPTKPPSSAACSSSAAAPSAIAAPTSSSRACPAGPSSTRGC